MGYISVKQASGKWRISVRRIQALCEQGKVFGAGKVGSVYVIPENTDKPKDRRKRSN